MLVLLWIVLMFFVVFRRKLLEPILGTRGFHVFDAMFWTIYGAWCFAQHNLLCTVAGMLSLLWTWQAVQAYKKVGAEGTKKNELDPKP